MAVQSELQLEEQLIKQLTTLGYQRANISNEEQIYTNLKHQLEVHNKVSLTEGEFAKVLNHLNKGNIFDKAAILRDKMPIKRQDGSTIYLEFINQEEWCKNQYQVASQVTIEGRHENRYDVTLFINGLPLCQVELKRRGLELKEAFNQINRYQRHSFGAASGLFQYVQIFVISNGVNTKYYSNNRKQSFKQTFFWADKENNNITQLDKFTNAFLEKCQLSKIICQYIVQHQADKILMVLRPYQYYATEAIIERVKETDKNGYIWHTTGSGKTLTSFKTAQLLTSLPKVKKVLFVVDRADLDYQTTKEFNAFSEGSVDGTDNTNSLVKQLEDKNCKLIVTTIQKLNNAISRDRYLKQMQGLQDEPVIFIFDECHRTQFGETHKRIKQFFNNRQMFGFTGTPIFAENASQNELGKRTTKELFNSCLHKYLIADAIKDENVLKLSVEYVGRYKQKEDSANYQDIEVEGIDKKELLESEERIAKIADYIIANHNRKTHSKDFSAIMCVANKDVLFKYYEAFKNKKEQGKHNLRIATIFSFGPNEPDADANGLIGDESLDITSMGKNSHSRDKLDSYIEDYNKMFGTSFSTKDNQSFYNYYKDIAKRLKERERETFQDKDRLDILLVVNMFLTGFDAKKVNTMYVDKNLKYHGLIQAFSRTNRTLAELKSQGNIVCFRNLKKATDEAVALFSNKEAKEDILMQPYEDYLAEFDAALNSLLSIAPSVESVDSLITEEEKHKFVKAFRNMMRIKNILSGFTDFAFDDTLLSEQNFEDYKSKYLDIYDSVKREKESSEKISILNDVDFELELIQRDEINVGYIIKLLASLYDASEEQKTTQRKAILDTIAGEAQLRSKRELITKFIDENMPNIASKDDIEQEFEKFWHAERVKAFKNICTDEDINYSKAEAIVETYLFSNREPLTQEIVKALNQKPKLLERKKITERVKSKLINFVEKFDS